MTGSDRGEGGDGATLTLLWEASLVGGAGGYGTSTAVAASVINTFSHHN